MSPSVPSPGEPWACVQLPRAPTRPSAACSSLPCKGALRSPLAMCLLFLSHGCAISLTTLRFLIVTPYRPQTPQKHGSSLTQKPLELVLLISHVVLRKGELLEANAAGSNLELHLPRDSRKPFHQTKPEFPHLYNEICLHYCIYVCYRLIT